MASTTRGRWFSGYLRTTFHYNAGWSALDGSAPVGEFRLLRSRTSRADPGVSIHTVRAPTGVAADLVRRALIDTFETACRCEHDCCGHPFTTVDRLERGQRRHWFVTVRQRLNV